MESLNKYINTQEFQDQYNKQIKPVLNEIDNILHPKFKVDIRHCILLICSIIYIVFSLTYLSKIVEQPVILGIIMAPAIACSFFALLNISPNDPETAVKKARILYKQKAINPILKAVYNDFKFTPNQRLSIKTKEKSLLFNKGLILDDGEDYFKFRLNEKVLHFCESQVFHERTNTIQNDAHMGQGIFISVDFPKAFQCKCVILQENCGFMQKTASLQKLTYKKSVLSSKTLPLIKLEKSPFETLFAVYGDDPIKIRYILTPSFMDRLVKLFEKFNYSFDVSFNDNRMYLKIKTDKDLFEPSFYRSNDNISLLKRNLEIIGDITDIVSDLNLDTKIWKA